MEREFQLEKERKQLQVMRGLLRKAFPEAEVSRERNRQLTAPPGLPGHLDVHGTPSAGMEEEEEEEEIPSSLFLSVTPPILQTGAGLRATAKTKQDQRGFREIGNSKQRRH